MWWINLGRTSDLVVLVAIECLTTPASSGVSQFCLKILPQLQKIPIWTMGIHLSLSCPVVTFLWRTSQTDFSVSAQTSYWDFWKQAQVHFWKSKITNIKILKIKQGLTIIKLYKSWFWGFGWSHTLWLSVENPLLFHQTVASLQHTFWRPNSLSDNWLTCTISGPSRWPKKWSTLITAKYLLLHP